MLRITFSLLLVVGVAQLARAHAGHSHDEVLRPAVTEAAVRSRVELEVRDLAGAKKIDASWSRVPLKRLDRVMRFGSSLWVALFVNPKVKTDSELFLFVNAYGDVVEGGFAMDEKGATTRMKAEIERLVAMKKVPPSWLTAAAPKLEKRPMGELWEWVGVVENADTPETPKLYVFLKPWGDFVAANHSGK